MVTTWPDWDDHKALHDDAMSCCDEAMRHKRGGYDVAAKRMYRAAFVRERRAAEVCPPCWWKAVLYRSAATLGLESGYAEGAYHCARAGLALEDVPGEIRAELEEVLAKADAGRVKA